jgi:tetratricopeptide (TPR) repeat protein
MGIMQNLAVVALRQLINGAAQAVGINGGGDAVVNFLADRFTDHSQRLMTALQKANERAWEAFEIALGGESLWDRCKAALARAEDQAFREQVRAFLDISPLTKASVEHPYLFQQALQELRAARSRGTLNAGSLAPAVLAREAGSLARFTDPQALLDAEWRLVNQSAGELQEHCPNLWRLLVARPKAANRPSLLAVAVRYYFRREVETDSELFQGLAFAKLEAIRESQDRGFAALTDALTRQGARLEGMLKDLMDTLGEINERVKRLEDLIKTLLQRLELQNRELRPSDSLSVRSEAEQRRVGQMASDYRALPVDLRRQRPGLQNELGKLEVAAGDFEKAQRDFQDAAAGLTDPKAKAEAHHNAYRAALERQSWAEALEAFKQAVAHDPERFAPYPADKYEPERILGAGGFGVAFLCRHKQLGAEVVVKTLISDGLDRSVEEVFAEARALWALHHPAIIRLLDCGYADAARTRPYLVMDFFDGMNLADYVAAHGKVSPDDLLAIARPVAEALQAAHTRNILHRDVKPANLLIRRDDAGWSVKVIDFGLALRPATLEGKASTEGSHPRSTLGRSIAGTLHYAAPEQMGRLQGVPVGSYSDVYGFGRTCYYALLGVPDPDDPEKEQLPDTWRRLLSRCTGRNVANRPQDFAAVLAELAQWLADIERTEGEAKLAVLWPAALLHTGGKPTSEQTANIEKVRVTYKVSEERARAIKAEAETWWRGIEAALANCWRGALERTEGNPAPEDTARFNALQQQHKVPEGIANAIEEGERRKWKEEQDRLAAQLEEVWNRCYRGAGRQVESMSQHDLHECFGAMLQACRPLVINEWELNKVASGEAAGKHPEYGVVTELDWKVREGAVVKGPQAMRVAIGFLLAGGPGMPHDLRAKFDYFRDKQRGVRLVILATREGDPLVDALPQNTRKVWEKEFDNHWRTELRHIEESEIRRILAFQGFLERAQELVGKPPPAGAVRDLLHKKLAGVFPLLLPAVPGEVQETKTEDAEGRRVLKEGTTTSAQPGHTEDTGEDTQCYWVIAPYSYDDPELWERVWQFDLANNLISIGWEVGDVSSMNEQRLRAALDAAFPDPDTTAQARGQFFGMIWNFYHEIKPGDIVIARRGRKVIAAVGTVTRRAYYEPQKNAPALGSEDAWSNHLDVRWHESPREKEFEEIVLGLQSVYQITPEKFRTMVGPTAGAASEDDGGDANSSLTATEQVILTALASEGPLPRAKLTELGGNAKILGAASKEGFGVQGGGLLGRGLIRSCEPRDPSEGSLCYEITPLGRTALDAAPAINADWLKVCRTMLELGAFDPATAVSRRRLHEKGCILTGYDPIEEAGLIAWCQTEESGREWWCYLTAAGRELAVGETG